MKNIEKFIDYLKYQKNYSLETIKNYRIDLESFYNYISSKNMTYNNITYNDAREYVKYLSEEKKEAASTVSRYISALRSFYNFLVKENVLEQNVFLLIKLPKKGKHLPKFFYFNEVEEMLNSIDTTSDLGKRNLLILELLYATGVRVSELINIKINDISLIDNKIKILGKGDKERYVYFDKRTKVTLDNYIKDVRPNLLSSKSDNYLILNSNGNVITTKGIRYLLNKIISKTSIEKNISPHMLRHSFATSLLNEGCDIMSVQELLGHASLSATGIYTHVTNDRLKEVYYNTMPRAKK